MPQARGILTAVPADCQHPGCPDAATRRPVVYVPARPPAGKPLQLPAAPLRGDTRFVQAADGPERYVVAYNICLAFCDRHAELFDWSACLDEQWWQLIFNHIRQIGYARPSQDDVTKTWFPAACRSGLALDEEIKRQQRLLNIVLLNRPELSPEKAERAVEEALEQIESGA